MEKKLKSQSAMAKKLNDIAEKIIVKALKNDKNQLLTYKISKSWNAILGPQISQMVKISEITSNGCLILKLTNHCYGMEINIYKELINERINTFLGQEVVMKVMIL